MIASHICTSFTIYPDTYRYCQLYLLSLGLRFSQQFLRFQCVRCVMSKVLPTHCMFLGQHYWPSPIASIGASVHQKSLGEKKPSYGIILKAYKPARVRLHLNECEFVEITLISHGHRLFSEWSWLVDSYPFSMNPCSRRLCLREKTLFEMSKTFKRYLFPIRKWSYSKRKKVFYRQNGTFMKFRMKTENCIFVHVWFRLKTLASKLEGQILLWHLTPIGCSKKWLSINLK